MNKITKYIKSKLFKQVKPNINGIPMDIIDWIDEQENVSSKIQIPYAEGLKKTLDEFSVPEGSTMESLVKLTDAPLNQWIQFEDLKWNHKKTYSYILDHSGDFSKPNAISIAECIIDNYLVWWYYNETLDICKIKLHKKLTLKD